MSPRRVSDYLAYLCLRVAICLLQALSIDTLARGSRLLAWFCHDVIRLRRRIVEENLRAAFPEWTDVERDRVARGMWRHLFLMVAEVAIASRKIHDTNWRNYIRLLNQDRMTPQLLGDRPTLLVSAHFGNFELGGYSFGLLGFPTYSVARTLDNPYIDRFLGRFRARTGQHILAKKGGYDDILRVVAEGGVLAFLADQYAGSKGCWVQFFGRPASAHKAIALLALEHRAPLVVMASRRLDRPLHYEGWVEGWADPARGGPETAGVRELTQWYTSRLEAVIRRAPEQYWWLHRRWKDHRRRKQSAARAA